MWNHLILVLWANVQVVKFRCCFLWQISDILIESVFFLTLLFIWHIWAFLWLLKRSLISLCSKNILLKPKLRFLSSNRSSTFYSYLWFGPKFCGFVLSEESGKSATCWMDEMLKEGKIIIWIFKKNPPTPFFGLWERIGI